MSESEQAINVSEWKELHAEIEEVRAKRDRLQTENNRLKALMQLTQKECDEAKEQLSQAKDVADMFEQENAELQDTVRHLREQRKAILAKQIHDDLPGILMVIQRAAEQARELI